MLREANLWIGKSWNHGCKDVSLAGKPREKDSDGESEEELCLYDL